MIDFAADSLGQRPALRLGFYGGFSFGLRKSPAQVALAWLLSKSTVTSVLLGASKLEQLENNLGSLDTHLSPDQIKRLDDISRVEMGFPHAILANLTIKQTISGGVEVHRK
jgi:hypothetical protein